MKAKHEELVENKDREALIDRFIEIAENLPDDGTDKKARHNIGILIDLIEPYFTPTTDEIIDRAVEAVKELEHPEYGHTFNSVIKAIQNLRETLKAEQLKQEYER